MSSLLRTRLQCYQCKICMYLQCCQCKHPVYYGGGGIASTWKQNCVSQTRCHLISVPGYNVPTHVKTRLVAVSARPGEMSSLLCTGMVVVPGPNVAGLASQLPLVWFSVDCLNFAFKIWNSQFEISKWQCSTMLEMFNGQGIFFSFFYKTVLS